MLLEKDVEYIYIQNKIQDNRLPLIILGGIIGAVVFLLIYGFAPLNFFNDNFVSTGYLEKDVSQHYAGWLLFKNSPWQFPLGVGSHMQYPYGGAVSFSDSIPLFAIIFKIFTPILPDTFQYFGLFVFLCFVLQGVFGALLVSLFSKNFLYSVVAGAFFTLSPIMIERAFRHCALSAHFLILASLYYYFKNKKTVGFKAFLPFFILNAIAITIHPYFLPFTFAIMFAFCLERFFVSQNRFLPIIYLFTSIASTLLVGFIVGAFYIKGGMGELGYGYFNMNLNSFFNPVSKNIESWSRFLKERPLIMGQIEGFNYLGFGILILLVFAVIILIAKYSGCIKAFIKSNYGIIFSTASLTVFAIGDYVVYGGLKLFRFPISVNIVENLFNIFRANGRFGNMLFYLLFLFAVVMLYKAVDAKFAIFICLVVFFVQLYDISGAIIYKHNYFTNFSTENKQYVLPTAQHKFWDDAIKLSEGVIEMESEQGAMFGNGIIDIAVKCGKNKKYINSSFLARTDFSSRMDFLQREKQSVAEKTANIVLYLVEETKFFDPFIKDGSYQAFEVDGQLVVIKSVFTPQKIKDYTSLGKFKQILIN